MSIGAPVSQGSDNQPLIDYTARRFLGASTGLIASGLPWFDVTHPSFAGGASGNGITSATAAENAAITRAGARGGIIFFPPGTYANDGPINAGGSTSLILLGTGGLSGGASTSTVLVYTLATGARFIDARASIGFQLRDMFVYSNNAAFAGITVDLGVNVAAAVWSGIDSCLILNQGFGAGSVALNLAGAEGAGIRFSAIQGGTITVQLGTGGPASVGISLIGTSLTYLVGCVSLLKGQVNGLTIDGGFWEGNNFNNTTVLIDLSTVAWGVSIKGLWAGDVTVGSSGTWISILGSGAVIEGLELGLLGTMTGINVVTGTSGMSVSGVNFQGGTATATGININAGVLGFDEHGNIFVGVTPVTGYAASGGLAEKIDEQTAGGAVAAITVPAAGTLSTRGRHLRIRIRARGDFVGTFGQILVQLNGDNGANYDNQQMIATGAGANPTNAEGLAQSGVIVGYFPGTTAVANTWSDIEITIRDYAAAIRQVLKSKAALHYTDATGGSIIAEGAGFWRTAAAITSLKIRAASGNLIAGSEVTTYIER